MAHAVFGVGFRRVGGKPPGRIPSLYPRGVIFRGWPSSHFGENELSPGLMRLSLLPTGPPPVFQHWWVRPSTACYGRFSLPMGRSPGFASIAPDMRRPVQTRFRCGSPPEGVNHSPGTITRRIIMQKARGQAGPKAIALPPLVGTGFQVQCPPLIGVLPTVRSPYWVRYRSSSSA